MKIRERYFDQDGKLIIHQQHSYDPYMARAKAAREVGSRFVSDGEHVASLPANLVYEEAKRRGVRFDDHAAMQDIMWSLIRNRDFNAFRVSERKV